MYFFVTLALHLLLKEATGLLDQGDTDLAILVHHLQMDVNTLKSQQFRDSVQIQGLSDELAKKELVIDNLMHQLNDMQEKQSNATDNLDQQKASLFKLERTVANVTSDVKNQEALLLRSEQKQTNIEKELDLLRASLHLFEQKQVNFTRELGSQKISLNTFGQGQVNITSELQRHNITLLNISEKQENQRIQVSNFTNKEHLTETLMSKIQAQCQDLRNDVKNITLDTVKLGADLERLRSDMHAGSNVGKGNRQVAFMTRFKPNTDEFQGYDISGMSILKFNDVLLNTGHAYNSTSGVFTAPVKGIYTFQLTAMVLDKIAKLDLTGEDGYYGTTAGYTSREQGTVNAVIHLDVGKKLWVKNIGYPKIASWGYTQFSGFLVNAD